MFRAKKLKRSPTASRPGVFSYYSSRSADESPEGRGVGRLSGKSFRLRQLKYVPMAMAFLAVIASLLYILSVDINPKIVVHGNSALLRDQASYREGVRKMLSHSVLNRTKLTINSTALERQVLSNFPEISSATITLAIMGRRPVVHLVPAQAQLLLVGQNGVFVIDDHGRATLPANELADAAHLNLPMVHDETDLTLEANQQVLTSEQTTIISNLHQQLTTKQLEIDKMTFPLVANELHVRLKNQPYLIKFNLAGDPRTQAGTFLAAKARFEGSRERPTEYVDVRVEERVYYK